MTLTPSQFAVLKLGIDQSPTDAGIRRLVKWIDDGKPLLLDGGIEDNGGPRKGKRY